MILSGIRNLKHTLNKQGLKVLTLTTLMVSSYGGIGMADEIDTQCQINCLNEQTNCINSGRSHLDCSATIYQPCKVKCSNGTVTTIVPAPAPKCNAIRKQCADRELTGFGLNICFSEAVKKTPGQTCQQE